MTTVETIQAATEAAVAIATGAGILIRLFGLQDYPWARRVLRLSVDVIGAAQVRKGDIPSIPETKAKQMTGVDP